MTRARGLLAASAMSVAAVFAAITPAQAASYDGSCNVDEACLYRNLDYAGGVYDTLNSKKTYSGMTYYGTSTATDNSVSSAKNRDPDSNLWFYSGTNWTGDSWGLPAGSNTNFSSSFENTPSSHCWSGATAGCPAG
ncbi:MULTISPECIES: peptidase inhibitor family I36 protein [Streptomyces]|uniref:Peptidase inhibitor family I36 protein n=1 Tax=Streptomyces liliifuscus TaxID=2797636 RepID=A0A7T7I536_9ACTN|nr:peptidase inhibitor family I36 protein [Streptomyces liliifuscus]QQM41198.1 peptidase inhibitor family I36 protein [Streptomyces liliifuscus]